MEGEQIEKKIIEMSEHLEIKNNQIKSLQR